MPIRSIARELYRVLKEVDKLEQTLATAPPEKQQALRDELRKLTAERNRMRAILNGKKER